MNFWLFTLWPNSAFPITPTTLNTPTTPKTLISTELPHPQVLPHFHPEVQRCQIQASCPRPAWQSTPWSMAGCQRSGGHSACSSCLTSFWRLFCGSFTRRWVVLQPGFAWVLYFCCHFTLCASLCFYVKFIISQSWQGLALLDSLVTKYFSLPQLIGDTGYKAFERQVMQYNFKTSLFDSVVKLILL